MFVFVIFAVIFVLIMFVIYNENKKKAAMNPEQLKEYEKTQEEIIKTIQYGPIVPEFICPHCQNKNCVRTQLVEKKIGISGAKATGAILTGGVSLLATGLSKKAKVTKAFCTICKQTWEF